MKIWYGPKLAVIICDPNLLIRAFKYNLQKDMAMYRFAKPSFSWCSNVFLENHVPKWRFHRKIIVAGTFTVASLKSFVEIFFQESLILGDKLTPLAKSKEAFELYEMMTLTTFSMVLRATSGLDMNIQKNCHSVLDNPFTDAGELLFKVC